MRVKQNRTFFLEQTEFKVVERSFLARIARWVLRSPQVAMVLGSTVHLSGVDRNTFLQNPRWVRHEMCHIRQFREHGFFRFLCLYCAESFRKGYYQNKYEVEAREGEGSR
jgi:hypothetical protein